MRRTGPPDAGLALQPTTTTTAALTVTTKPAASPAAGFFFGTSNRLLGDFPHIPSKKIFPASPELIYKTVDAPTNSGATELHYL